MPDAAGRFKGISVPELPWLTPQEMRDDIEAQEHAVLRPCECGTAEIVVNPASDIGFVCAGCGVAL